jgi:hypothetical protein
MNSKQNDPKERLTVVSGLIRKLKKDFEATKDNPLSAKQNDIVRTSIHLLEKKIGNPDLEEEKDLAQLIEDPSLDSPRRRHIYDAEMSQVFKSPTRDDLNKGNTRWKQAVPSVGYYFPKYDYMRAHVARAIIPNDNLNLGKQRKSKIFESQTLCSKYIHHISSKA